MAVLIPLAACGSDDNSSNDPPTENTTAPDGAASDVPDVIGETVDDATATLEAADMTLRVIRRDGEDLPATMDFIENRVNVAVETQDDGSEVVTEVVSTG